MNCWSKQHVYQKPAPLTVRKQIHVSPKEDTDEAWLCTWRILKQDEAHSTIRSHHVKIKFTLKPPYYLGKETCQLLIWFHRCCLNHFFQKLFSTKWQSITAKIPDRKRKIKDEDYRSVKGKTWRRWGDNGSDETIRWWQRHDKKMLIGTDGGNMIQLRTLEWSDALCYLVNLGQLQRIELSLHSLCLYYYSIYLDLQDLTNTKVERNTFNL